MGSCVLLLMVSRQKNPTFRFMYAAGISIEILASLMKLEILA